MQLPIDLDKPIPLVVHEIDEYRKDGYYRVTFAGVLENRSIPTELVCSEDSDQDLSHIKLSPSDQSIQWISLTFALSDTELAELVKQIKLNMKSNTVTLLLTVQVEDIEIDVDDVIVLRCLGISDIEII